MQPGVALGADLPIGLPRAYAASRPETDFLTVLRGLGGLPDFFRVCASLNDIGPGDRSIRLVGRRDDTPGACACACAGPGRCIGFVAGLLWRATAERRSGQ